MKATKKSRRGLRRQRRNIIAIAYMMGNCEEKMSSTRIAAQWGYQDHRIDYGEFSGGAPTRSQVIRHSLNLHF